MIQTRRSSPRDTLGQRQDVLWMRDDLRASLRNGLRNTGTQPHQVVVIRELSTGKDGSVTECLEGLSVCVRSESVPRFHKLSKAEIRALEGPQVRPELVKYVEFIKELRSGDWARVTLAPREDPTVIKRRLTAASKTQGKTLRYSASSKSTAIVFSVQGQARQRARRRRRQRRQVPPAPAPRRAAGAAAARKVVAKVPTPAEPAKEGAA
jgi:hypothetical protein